MPPYPSFEVQYASLCEEDKALAAMLTPLYAIDGWLRLSEMLCLYRLARGILVPNPIICEIGSWKGKSSSVLATAAKEIGGILYCIDPFNGEGDESSRPAYQKKMQALGSISLLQNFQNTMREFGLSETIKILPHLSEDARPRFIEDHIDLLFIDGNHDYSVVKRDYELWSGLIARGGTITLHDVGAVHVDGPRRVMREFLETDPKWRNVRMIGEMGVATRV